jgi:AcrR family transcriptional regulator
VSPTRAGTRPRLPRGEGDRLRDEILEAAERLLLATGSEEAVSIRAVADAANVSVPSIYRHFGDKQDLIFDVCARHFERLQQALTEAVDAVADDPLEALRVAAIAYVRFAVENPEHYRIMFMGRSELTPERYAADFLIDTSAFAVCVRSTQACADAGLFRDDLPPVYDVALALWAAVHGVASLAVAKPNLPGPPVDERVATVVDICLRGVLRP